MWVRFVTQVGHFVQRLEELLLAGSILTIAGLSIVNVGCRSLLGFSVAATEEIAQFCIIVTCFVGLSYAASKGRHIRMTAIYDQLPRRVRKQFMLAITASTSALMFVLAGYAVAYVAAVRELGGIYPALRIPFYAVYAIAPLGFLLAGIQYLLAAVRNLSDKAIYVSFETVEANERPVSQEL